MNKLIFKWLCEPYNQKSTDWPCEKSTPKMSRDKCLDCDGPVELSLPTKTCTGCKQSLPLTSFNNDRTKKDGLATRCRNCRQESNRKRKEVKKEFMAMRKAINDNCANCPICRHGCYFDQWSPNK